jgi:hypothetical protein
LRFSVRKTAAIFEIHDNLPSRQLTSQACHDKLIHVYSCWVSEVEDKRAPELVRHHVKFAIVPQGAEEGVCKLPVKMRVDGGKCSAGEKFWQSKTQLHNYRKRIVSSGTDTYAELNNITSLAARHSLAQALP